MKNNFKGLVIILFAILGMSACKDEVNLEYPYLFRPINFNAELVKTEVTLSWSEVQGAESYTLQVSTDSLNFSDIVLDTTVTDNNFKQDFEGKKSFFARIRANSSDSTKNSKFNQIGFKTPSENILILNQVLVSAQKTVQVAWESARKVTHIEFEYEGVIESFNVNIDETLVGLKTCVLANNNANYTIRVFNGSVLRGTTKLKVEGDMFLNAGDNLKGAIEGASGSSYIIVLQPGEYTISSVNICPNGTSLFIKGVDPTNHSIVNLQANSVMFTLPAVADSIILKNIDFIAVTPSNTAYFINQSLASNVGKLMLDGCNLTGFGNNFLRMQNASGEKRITDLIVNNSIVTNMGNGATGMPSNGTYAFVNSNIDNGHIKNIKISNSTFNGVSHTLINVPGLSGSTATNIVSSIDINNTTFYNVVGGSTSTRYLIDGGSTSNNATIDVNLSNLIFAKTMATNTPGGIRKAAGKLDVSNVYTTTDWGSTVIIPGANAYAGSSSDLWNSPSTGDFTLKDVKFAGRGSVGDLRWY